MGAMKASILEHFGTLENAQFSQNTDIIDLKLKSMKRLQGG